MTILGISTSAGQGLFAWAAENVLRALIHGFAKVSVWAHLGPDWKCGLDMDSDELHTHVGSGNARKIWDFLRSYGGRELIMHVKEQQMGRAIMREFTSFIEDSSIRVVDGEYLNHSSGKTLPLRGPGHEDILPNDFDVPFYASRKRSDVSVRFTVRACHGKDFEEAAIKGQGLPTNWVFGVLSPAAARPDGLTYFGQFVLASDLAVPRPHEVKICGLMANRAESGYDRCLWREGDSCATAAAIQNSVGFAGFERAVCGRDMDYAMFTPVGRLPRKVVGPLARVAEVLRALDDVPFRPALDDRLFCVLRDPKAEERRAVTVDGKPTQVGDAVLSVFHSAASAVPGPGEGSFKDAWAVLRLRFSAIFEKEVPWRGYPDPELLEDRLEAKYEDAWCYRTLLLPLSCAIRDHEISIDAVMAELG